MFSLLTCFCTGKKLLRIVMFLYQCTVTRYNDEESNHCNIVQWEMCQRFQIRIRLVPVRGGEWAWKGKYQLYWLLRNRVLGRGDNRISKKLWLWELLQGLSQLDLLWIGTSKDIILQASIILAIAWILSASGKRYDDENPNHCKIVLWENVSEVSGKN